jgi:hypothetical protein
VFFYNIFRSYLILLCFFQFDFINNLIIDSIVENIGKIFVESTKITFGTFCSTKSRPRQKKSEDKPWFNVECKLARKNNRKLRRKYKKNRTEKNKEELNNSEKYYKRTLDKKFDGAPFNFFLNCKRFSIDIFGCFCVYHY